jgi:Spy/CpxP family protein refolding chaperone
MKKLLVLPILFFFGLIAQAQVSSDSTHSHRTMIDGKRHWGGADSLHRRGMGGIRDGRDQAGDRFRSNERDHRFHDWSHADRRSHSFRRPGFGGQAIHVHFSPEQRKQARSINETYRKNAADLYKNDNLTLREYKSQLLALQKEKRSKMKALLTPEQKDQVAKWKKQAGENAQVRDAAFLERMRLRLQLSDAQAANIKSQRVSLRTQMQSIHENEDLLPYQKMEQIKAMRDKNKDIMKSVLTPEQLTEFENMHKQRLGEK